MRFSYLFDNNKKTKPLNYKVEKPKILSIDETNIENSRYVTEELVILHLGGWRWDLWMDIWSCFIPLNIVQEFWNQNKNSQKLFSQITIVNVVYATTCPSQIVYELVLLYTFLVELINNN